MGYWIERPGIRNKYCVAKDIMLLCKQMNCLWHLVYLSLDNASFTARNSMSKTLSLGITPSTTWFSRLLSVIDRILMTNAEIAHRNGDLPYFGL
jgi:hypothetical protein